MLINNVDIQILMVFRLVQLLLLNYVLLQHLSTEWKYSGCNYNDQEVRSRCYIEGRSDGRDEGGAIMHDPFHMHKVESKVYEKHCYKNFMN